MKLLRRISLLNTYHPVLKACLIFSFSLLVFSSSQAQTQATMADSNVAVAAVKLILQGLWAGPDESYYFLFRGDSVKEWESDGADSSAKPWCNFVVSHTACDTASAHAPGATGVFLAITCHSPDYDETRCYFIQFINAVEVQLGIKGRFDESGDMKKVKSNN